MNTGQARTLISQTFTQAFDKSHFRNFTINLLNHIDEAKASQWNTTYIKDAFKDHVHRYERLGTYTSPDKERLDVLIVHLTAESKLERTRTAIRNFVADHLRTREEKDAALVAFVSPAEKQWRFSYVKMEYATVEKESGKIGVETRLTPARRFSYLVGEGESCHTAQTRFLDLLQDTETNPVLADIEDAFSVEAVTKEFFTKYAELFGNMNAALEKLVTKDKTIRDELKAKNVSTVDFAKKLLGQIVFLYFLQKKGWLGVAKGKDWGTGPRDFLRRLVNREYGQYGNFFNDILEPLFYDTLATDRGHEAWCNRFKCRIPFLNGGLFEPLGDYDWRKTDIILPNELFTNSKYVEENITGTGVLDVFDRYNFTVNEAEPLEKEVAIDPEMLGKVFENLIEENRRKGLGAYYTPREIVHYMCQESLVNYLDTALNTTEASSATRKSQQIDLLGTPDLDQTILKTTARREIVPLADIETFVHLGDQISHYEAVNTKYAIKMPKSIEQHAKIIDDKLADITICDPAVGSGAFPVGMMSEIVRARTALTPYFNAIEERTPYHFKRHAIQSCLYGVDVDAGAVEIAKLRLWLSLVVDEEETKQIKPLPNLDFKIASGNSLLGYPFKPQWLSEIEKLKVRFFEETNHDGKAELKRKIERKLSECFASSKKSLGYEVTFDFEICFSEVFHARGGFDVIIANPPYVRQEKIKDQKPLFADAYECFDGRADLYVYFYERGVKLLREGGVLSYISSNKFFRAGYGERLRQFFGSKTQLRRIIDFGDLPIFEATAYPCIVVARRNSALTDHAVATLTVGTEHELNRFTELATTHTVSMKQGDFGKGVWHLGSQLTLGLLAKLRATGKPLSSVVADKIYAGIKTGLNEAFVIDVDTRSALIAEDPKSREIIKPFIKGKDIGRWGAETKNRFIIYTSHDTRINDYPAIKRHLMTFKSDLEKRALDQKWFELQQPQLAFTKEFEKTKIVYPNVALGCRFALNSQCYLDMTAFCICSSDLALLGILNSTLMSFFFAHLGIQRRGGYQEFKTQYVRELPIPVTSAAEHDAVAELVDRIIAARGRDAEADTAKWEREIDRLVYTLYRLTPEDIAIVEKSFEPIELARANNER